MLKVIDTFDLGDRLSVTLKGPHHNIKNGTKLIDENGNIIIVKSVAMIRYTYPKNFDNSITVLLDSCNIIVGSKLRIIDD